jgi:chromatin segregation and condensation protein Rec8/ScpA/Scc1 (kleisin family)
MQRGKGNMKASIKIVKRKRNEDSTELKTSDGEKSVEQSTREIVGTVKSWIVELQQRKRAQASSFPQLPVVATAR